MSGPGQFSRGAQPSPQYSPLLQSALQRLDDLFHRERIPPESRLQARRLRAASLPPLDLLKRLGSPQRDFNAVHVTGSKGKGTVSALIAAALVLAPFTRAIAETPVGTISSPHVERFTERLQLNGSPIGDDAFAEALHTALDARHRPARLPKNSWFDVISAASMLALRRANASRVVIEAGLGGRLDGTNVLDAPVAVITNVYHEHANVIGPTIQDIAYEKAGIIKPGAKVLVGMSERDHLCDAFRREATSTVELAFHPPLPGERIFSSNLRLAQATVRTVARREGLDVDVEALMTHDWARGVLSRLPARQELFSLRDGRGAAVPVLLDGAHVPESVEMVLREMGWAKRPVVVLACSREKDILGMCRIIVEHAHHVVATVSGVGDTFTPVQEIGVYMNAVDRELSCDTVENSEEALEKALDKAGDAGTGVVVIGSMVLAGRLRPLLRGRGTKSVEF